MVQKLQQQAKHYRALEIGARHTADMIDVAIGKLKTEIHKLQKVAKALRDADELAGRKRDEELNQLNSEIDSLNQTADEQCKLVEAAQVELADLEQARSAAQADQGERGRAEQAGAKARARAGWCEVKNQLLATSP